MKIELITSPEMIDDIALLFQRELDQRAIYGTVYTSPELGDFLNKLNIGGVDQFLTVTDFGALLGALQFRIFENALHINNIVVSSNYRGKNIGSRLIDWLIERASKLGKDVTLDVSLNNEKALSWYKRIGFVENMSISNRVFECNGMQSLNQIFIFDNGVSFNDYGFSDARLEPDEDCRFFCIKECFIRLKRGAVTSADEISWFKRNFKGYLIVGDENINNTNDLMPDFIQAISRMELKCG